MLKKIHLDKINDTKNAFYFLSRAPTHHSFTFNLRFLYELKHMVHLSKTLYEIFHFRFRFVFIKIFIVVQQNTWTLTLTLKRHNSFLIFKLQEEVLKFNDICVSWSSPKTELETNFLNLENRFEKVSFSQ